MAEMQVRHLCQSRHLLVAAAVICATSATSATSPVQLLPDCHHRDAAAVTARERAAAEWPKALLPQIELAVCYDKAWRFQEVEPAIAKAAALLDAEIATAVPTARPSGARPVAGSDVLMPRRTRNAEADYPARALVAGITGTVIVELVIDAKGNVREARAVKSVPELDDAAVKTARKWKFEPTVVSGTAVEVTSYASIRFGQTTEPIPSDQLAMATFYYERGLLKPARSALDAAIAKARDDRVRFEGYAPAGSLGRSGGIAAPVKTKDVRPGYPPGALSSQTQGTVVIEALLDTTGKVGRARVLSKPSVLDAAALTAVLQWEFQPAMRNGAPAAVAMTTTVSFSLGPRRH
jgi:TonB family protein